MGKALTAVHGADTHSAQGGSSPLQSYATRAPTGWFALLTEEFYP